MSLNISSTTLNQFSTSSAYRNVKVQTDSKVSDEKTESIDSIRFSSTSLQGDTLQVSEEAAALYKQSQETATSTESKGSGTEILTSSTDEEEDEESSVSDLTSYSASQLKELYQNGEITAAQYAQEMKRREGEADSDDVISQSLSSLGSME